LDLIFEEVNFESSDLITSLIPRLAMTVSPSFWNKVFWDKIEKLKVHSWV